MTEWIHLRSDGRHLEVWDSEVIRISDIRKYIYHEILEAEYDPGIMELFERVSLSELSHQEFADLAEIEYHDKYEWFSYFDGENTHILHPYDLRDGRLVIGTYGSLCNSSL